MAAGAPRLSWANIGTGLHTMSFQAARGLQVSCALNQITHPKTVPSKPSYRRDSEHSNHNQHTCSLCSLVQLKVHVTLFPDLLLVAQWGMCMSPVSMLLPAYLLQLCQRWGSQAEQGSREQVPFSAAVAGHGVDDPGHFGVSASHSLPPALKPVRR